MSGIGCSFMFLTCSNFNPVTKNSSSRLKLFAALQECIYITNFYGAIIFFMRESILLCFSILLVFRLPFI